MEFPAFWHLYFCLKVFLAPFFLFFLLPQKISISKVIILGDISKNITTHERAASVTLFHLVPGMTYTVKVAARTKGGVGVYREMEPVTMSKCSTSCIQVFS